MADPIRIGIMNDTLREPAPEGGSSGANLPATIALAIEERTAQGRIDREVELIHVYGAGLPQGTAAGVERAFAQLVDEGVLLVVGPAIGDNAILATPLADHYRMPTINWSASERARSDWMFHLQVGSHEDESILMARHIADQGVKRIGVVYDKSPIGRRHMSFFEAECDVLELNTGARLTIAPLAETALDEVRYLQQADVEALVYMGLGFSGREVARAKTELGWDVPTVMNAAGMRGRDPAFGRDLDGWVYPDMYADDNRVLTAVEAKLSDSMRTGALAYGYDMGQLVAEAIARAWELTRDGLKEGLEQTKVVPAAEGYDGTVLGFGRWDRGALKGRYLVMRQWRDAVSVQVS